MIFSNFNMIFRFDEIFHESTANAKSILGNFDLTKFDSISNSDLTENLDLTKFDFENYHQLRFDEEFQFCQKLFLQLSISRIYKLQIVLLKNVHTRILALPC